MTGGARAHGAAARRDSPRVARHRVLHDAHVCDAAVLPERSAHLILRPLARVAPARSRQRSRVRECTRARARARTRNERLPTYSLRSVSWCPPAPPPPKDGAGAAARGGERSRGGGTPPSRGGDRARGGDRPRAGDRDRGRSAERRGDAMMDSREAGAGAAQVGAGVRAAGRAPAATHVARGAGGRLCVSAFFLLFRLLRMRICIRFANGPHGRHGADDALVALARTDRLSCCVTVT